MTLIKNATFLLLEFCVALAISLGFTWVVLYYICTVFDL